jgi:hypothetical protein
MNSSGFRAPCVIAVEFTQEDGKRDLQFTKTDDKGHYIATTEARSGRIVAQAYFSCDRENGQPDNAPSSSAPRRSDARLKSARRCDTHRRAFTAARSCRG